MAKIGDKNMVSTAIKTMEYDWNNGDQILDIEFQTGSKYRYRNVPMATFNGLANAESRGKYFVENIRNKFKFTKVR